MKSTAPQHAITDALVALRGGEPDALERLVPLVYDHLYEMAHHHLRLESTGHTLSTTAVVYEAYSRFGCALEVGVTIVRHGRIPLTQDSVV